MLSSRNPMPVPVCHVEAMPIYLQHEKLVGSLLFAVLLRTYALKRDIGPRHRLDFAVRGFLAPGVEAVGRWVGCRLCPFCLIDFLAVRRSRFWFELVFISCGQFHQLH